MHRSKKSHVSIVLGEFKYKLNDDACMIIPYPTVEEKHIWQVYVTSELKKRYLNISAVLKFATTQNEPKRAATK